MRHILRKCDGIFYELITGLRAYKICKGVKTVPGIPVLHTNEYLLQGDCVSDACCVMPEYSVFLGLHLVTSHPVFGLLRSLLSMLHSYFKSLFGSRDPPFQESRFACFVSKICTA